MKTKIFLLLILITSLGYSQASIPGYFSADESKYAIVTTAVDNSPSGANAIWNFTSLTKDGETTDSYAAPTASELIDYPNTTTVFTAARDGGEGKIFSEINSGATSFIGVEAEGLVLSYTDFSDGFSSIVGDKALVGTFPLSFTTPATTETTDDVAGNFTFEDLLGPDKYLFFGTITSEVDAYGTLTVNGTNIVSFSGAVTRLKIVQDLTLNIANGNIIQTSYNYYDDSNGNLVFRTSTIEITSSISSANGTTTVSESYIENTLGVSENEVSELDLSIFPNPVKNDLNFKLSNAAVISSVTISDISGRQVLKTNTNVGTLSVNQLNRGLYIASITTNIGTFSRKFIKE